jgi:murein L,D-transpeptidase YafK
MKGFIRRLVVIVIAVGAGFTGLYLLLWRLGYVASLRSLVARQESSECSIITRQTLQPTQAIHRPPIATQIRLTNQSLESLIAASSLQKSQVSLLVEKANYRLTVYYDKQPIKSYPIVLGGNPVGDKRHEGDNKTPEGIFQIRDHYPHPDWSQFLWLDYPTQVSWYKHCLAKQSGQISPLVSVGGEIGIHGVPKGNDSFIDQRQNWTSGCISLKRQDVDELASVIQVGTVVEIIP